MILTYVLCGLNRSHQRRATRSRMSQSISLSRSLPAVRSQPIGWRLPKLGRARRFVSPLLLILAWQAGSMLGFIPVRTVSSPADVMVSFVHLIGTGELQQNL